MKHSLSWRDVAESKHFYYGGVTWVAKPETTWPFVLFMVVGLALYFVL